MPIWEEGEVVVNAVIIDDLAKIEAPRSGMVYDVGRIAAAAAVITAWTANIFAIIAAMAMAMKVGVDRRKHAIV